MKSRLDNALGHYWGGIAQAVDVLAAVTALGAIGGLPVLVNVLTRNTRLAVKWMRRMHHPAD
jgi:hypothetical protein